MSEHGNMGESQNQLMPLGPDMDKFIPSFMQPMCYVIYDGYPGDKRKIDITVCLEDGRVLELAERICVSSIRLQDVSTFKEIIIMRNSNGDRFYLIVAENEIIILLSIDHLSVHRRIPGAIQYEVCDPECSGEPKLMVKTASSVVYISFADIKDTSQEVQANIEYTTPVISLLAKKLIEAKYNLDHNKKAYRRIEKLRQRASFLCHEDGPLKIKTFKPIVRFCNKKIIIQLDVENPLNESINKVYVLIHNNSCPSISYTSKVYEYESRIPFYEEVEDRNIRSKTKAAVVAVIPISEFKSSIIGRIDFSAIISYEYDNRDYLQSFDDVQISAADVIGENFDVSNSPEIDERCVCMAILSSTVKTNLRLKHKTTDGDICLATNFSNYLKMDLLGGGKKIAIHKHSPFHVLHGIAIIFDENNKYIDRNWNEISYKIDVYARCPSQVLALIHYIYDTVPFPLVVTTANMKAVPHRVTDDDFQDTLIYNYDVCMDSLLKQCSMTLEYLDDCLKEMNKSRNMEKADLQVDLFAKGYEEFINYRNNMLAESEHGFKYVEKLQEQKIKFM